MFTYISSISQVVTTRSLCGSVGCCEAYALHLVDRHVMEGPVILREGEKVVVREGDNKWFIVSYS